LVKVPVATADTAPAVLLEPVAVSHLAARGAAWTAAAINARVETALVNFILTNIYDLVCVLGGEKKKSVEVEEKIESFRSLQV
jgi:hypothetical protein